MPFQFAKVQGLYEKELGIPRSTGCLLTPEPRCPPPWPQGDVQISFSQGLPPFVVAASAGQDLKIVDIAVSYSENDNCVVAEALEIDKTNAKELEGKKVGLPIGTAAHYGFLKQMEHFDVDVNSMEIVDMAPADGAAAFAQGNMDMVCGYGGALRRMKEHGNVLLTGAEKEEAGILVFDVVSAPTSFTVEESDLLSKFIKVTAQANAMWSAGDKKDEMLAAIAKDAGMDAADAEASLATFGFPTIEEKLSEKWLGGGVQSFMGGVAQVFKDAGSISATLESYEDRVDASLLSSASE